MGILIKGSFRTVVVYATKSQSPKAGHGYSN